MQGKLADPFNREGTAVSASGKLVSATSKLAGRSDREPICMPPVNGFAKRKVRACAYTRMHEAHRHHRTVKVPVIRMGASSSWMIPIFLRDNSRQNPGNGHDTKGWPYYQTQQNDLCKYCVTNECSMWRIPRLCVSFINKHLYAPIVATRVATCSTVCTVYLS